MVHFLTAVLAVTSALTAVSAVKSLPRQVELPAATTKVAADETAGVLIAFDANNNTLGDFPITARFFTRGARNAKRQTGTCFPMTTEDLPKLPGIDKIRAKADELWGDGSRNEVVNDPDFPENPANVCADEAGALVVYDSEPECKEVKNSGEGSLEGGKLILENSLGVNMKVTNTVTQTSKFGVGTKVSAKIEFPLIADVTSEVSTNFEVSNTQGEANEVGSDQRTVQRVEQPVSGDNCVVELVTKSCSVNGEGSLNMVAEGLMWFQFEDKVDGHFKWGLVLEEELPELSERSSVIKFKTSGSVDSQATFSAEGCVEEAVVTPV